MRRRRIDLSGTYVVASTLATVTGAVIASFFGIYGTIIGTAVISVASTAGAAVYQATLQRGREQIVQMGPVMASRARAVAHTARHGGPEDTTVAGYAHPGDDDGDVGRGNGTRPRAGSDNGAATADDATAPQQGVHPLGTGEPAARGETAEAQGAASAAEAQSAGDARTSGHARGTGEAGSAGDGGAGSGAQGGADRNGTEGAAQPVHGAAGGNGSLWSRIGWKRVGAMAASVFVVAIGVITAIELLAGKPMGAILGGQNKSGTSVGSVFGGQPAATPSTVQPSPSVSRQRNTPATRTAPPTHPPSPAPSSSTSRTSGPSPTPSAPRSSTAPGNGPPPSAPIPPVGDPTGGTVQNGGTSAQDGPTP